MSFVNAGDVIKIGEFAWKLWELKFSKAKNAGMRITTSPLMIRSFFPANPFVFRLFL